MKQLVSILGGIIISVSFTFAILYLISLPPRDITPDEIYQAGVPLPGPKEPSARETTLIDSSELNGNDKLQVDYFIIVGSFGNLKQAQKNAEKLMNDFNTNIIVLPSSKEGYYRISCGKYSALEEAKSKIKSIRTNIKSDAWIFPEKK